MPYNYLKVSSHAVAVQVISSNVLQYRHVYPILYPDYLKTGRR